MVFGVFGSIISPIHLNMEVETYFHSSDINRLHEQGGCGIADNRKFAKRESPSGQPDTDV
jgi:hypothetical protein